MKNILIIDVERTDRYDLPYQLLMMLDIVLSEFELTYYVVKNRYGSNGLSFPKDRLDDFLKFPNRDENFNII